MLFRSLYDGLNNYSHINCFFLAGRESGKTQDKDVIYHRRSIPQAVNHICCYIKNGQRERDWYTTKKIISMIRQEKIDIIHFHNIHGGYIGIKDIGEISKYCKIVWTLHDMWAITGHCAYSCQCNEWIEDSCRHCSNLELYPAIYTDKTERIYAMKRNIFTNKNIHFVVPSKWLMKQCERSFLSREIKILIHNGVNTDSFYPINKEILRKKYNMSQDKLILMFVANNIGSIYKGADILENALHRIKNKKEYEFIIVGNVENNSLSRDYICHYMGYIQSDEKMNELYNLADVFIISSRAENFPCTVIESMAAGTPVIASDVGGIAEQIDGNTGWLFEMENVEQLAEIIDGLIDEKEKLQAMGINCRKRVEENFSEEKMLKTYQKLYADIMSGIYRI